MSKLIEEIAQETTEQLPALQIFKNEEFGSVRTIIIDNEPWFVAKDVCDILGIQNPTDALNKQLEDFERTRFNLGRQGEANIISESGFYTLVLRSRKPIAKPFRLWVTSEVLPQIRKTGGYIPVKEEDTDLEIMAKAHQIMERTIEEKNKKIEEQQILLEEKDAKIEEQQERIEDLEETEKDWKTLMDTTGTFSINQLSQFINIGEYHLFEYLRKLKVLWKNENNDNVPYRQHLSSGKFAVVPAVAPNGVVHSQTRVYPEGIPYITKLLRKNGYLA